VTAAEPSTNGNGRIDNGAPGDLVFRLMSPGLAKEFRKLGFKAICHFTELHKATHFDGGRRVIVGYVNKLDLNQA
jgi:hypothetical protein